MEENFYFFLIESKLYFHFSYSSHSIVVFIPVGLSLLIKTSSAGLVGCRCFYSYPATTWKPTIICAEDVVITTKGLQE